MMPRDITDAQKKVALLWNYRLLTEQKVVHLDTLLKNIFLFIAEEYQKRRSSIQVTKLTDRGSEVYMIFKMQDLRRLDRQIFMYYARLEETPRKNLIERFFQWNRFIRDGKRDLNSVSDYDELYGLVKEAEPLYKEWQAKQQDKDADKGQELLLDDESWQVIAIHNKGAACKLGKGTDWCTAAPGLDYFAKYYSPEDPLFYILNKSDGQKYQFHFGTEQYMDASDMDLRFDNTTRKTFDQIILVLDEVIPEKYTLARNGIKQFVKPTSVRKY
jgi:hypothetical protein